MDVQKLSSKWSSTSSYLNDTTPAWTPHVRAKDVLNMIVYQFLFDWQNTCLDTPWTSKRCPQRDPLQVPIWVSQPYLNTPWTCKRCPQRDRLPIPIWLTQNQFEHPMDVQKMSSKWSSTSSYLTDTTPAWAPHERAKDVHTTSVLKMIVYQFLFDWQNTCLNTPWTSKRCPQRDPLQVPIWVSQPYLNTPWTCKRCPQRDRLPIPIWLTQNQFEHTMDIQKMSSKWSSTSSYLTDTTPAWAPHERAKDVLKMIVYLFLLDWHIICLNTPWTSKRCPQTDPLQVLIWVSLTLFEHPMNVQKMSSKWSSTSSYLTDTKPVWTPHGRPKDGLKGIVYLFLFDWTQNQFEHPDGRAKDVLKGIVYQFLFECPQHLFEHPMDVQKMSSKGSSTSSYLRVPTLFEHPMDVQQMSSNGSPTSSYLTDTTSAWTPHERPKWCPQSDPLQVPIWVSQPYLNTPWTCKRCPQRDRLPVPIWLNQPCLNTTWTCKRCPQRDRLPVPIWLTQHLFEHPKNVQKMSSKWSPTCSYLTNTEPVWTPRGHAKDILKGIVYQFLFGWHNTCLNTPWTSKWCPQRDPLQVPIWVSQPYLNTPWTCNRCPQSDHLPVPIWLTQHLLKTPCTCKRGHPMSVQMIVYKGIAYQFLFDWHNTCLEHPMDVQMMSSKGSSTSSYLSVPTLFEHPMDVQKMSSKGSSTSSYLTNTKPVWTPHERPKDVLKVIVYQFLFDWHNTCLEHPMNVQKMSSKWSSICSY